MNRLLRTTAHINPSNVIEKYDTVDGLSATIWRNGCCSIELDRKESMNSLTLSNIRYLTTLLKSYICDDRVSHIVIYPVHILEEQYTDKRKKAYCAGGDLKEFISCNREEFTRIEYTMDCLIQQYPKPIISIMDGITMGGGAGISCLCYFRIVTENTIFSMPEAGIGWITDCGSSYFLSSPRVDESNGIARSSNHIKYAGEYITLTGCRLSANELKDINVATHYIKDSQSCALLLSQLQNVSIRDNRSCFSALEQFLNQRTDSFPSVPSKLLLNKEEIESCFSAASVEEIISRLQNSSTEWAAETLKSLQRGCPSSLMVIFQLIRSCKNERVQECFQKEYTVGQRMEGRADLQEGVAAVLIRKDFKPKWNPQDISYISKEWCDNCFGLSSKLPFHSITE